ncbi:DUF6020 family protein [Loigolactobacillus iwatensis]|uniref:DUF6020 family protein n=1 Tax=Loigolactobacillus iwatensis TaxID=1267156 RepID=UPI001CDD01F5|nr:DUF6020 family protein [Loigolactobacillus iwatensis]
MQIKITRYFIGIMVLALFSTYAIGGMIKSYSNLNSLSNSVFSLIIYGAILVLFYKVKQMDVERRLWGIALLIGGLFSAFMVIGVKTLTLNTTDLNHLTTWLKIIFGIPVFGSLLITTFKLIIPRANYLTFDKFNTDKLEKFFTIKQSFIVVWALIFIAWIPSLVASYPGIYGYDSVYQIGYYLSGEICLHHPLIDTYLIGFCVVTLGNILGSNELGLLIYSIFQMSILSYSFAVVIRYMTKKRVSILWRILFILIFMFLPVNPIMSFSATKDIIYAATFLLILVKLFSLADDPHQFNNITFIATLIITIFINIIFRSQGLYVFLFSAIFGLFYFRRYWKQLLIVIVLPLLMYLIYSGPVTSALNGVKFDSLHEMMSVPAVQLSKALDEDSGELSQYEKNQIKQYIPDYKTIEGNYAIADSMKNTFNSELLKANPSSFVKLWLQVGIKKPLTYVNAFARLTIGLWYPDMNYRDPKAYHPYWEYISTQQNSEKTFFIVERQVPRFMKWLSSIYYQLTYSNSYQKVSVLSMFFSSGIYTWLLIVYIGWVIYQRRYHYLYPASLVLGLWLTLLLGPVVLYRYVYPIAVAIPLFIGDMLAGKGNSANEKQISE